MEFRQKAIRNFRSIDDGRKGRSMPANAVPKKLVPLQHVRQDRLIL